jgi:hypothetical protein
MAAIYTNPQRSELFLGRLFLEISILVQHTVARGRAMSVKRSNLKSIMVQVFISQCLSQVK